ncbi:hypothetical protein LSAT2_032339 [Lamellibrachia satsuma]|nr:hypothetical protein LSAT2_032339 [Lamellibrachia satsuma]
MTLVDSRSRQDTHHSEHNSSLSASLKKRGTGRTHQNIALCKKTMKRFSTKKESGAEGRKRRKLEEEEAKNKFFMPFFENPGTNNANHRSFHRQLLEIIQLVKTNTFVFESLHGSRQTLRSEQKTDFEHIIDQFASVKARKSGQVSGFGAATFTGRRLCTGGCRKSACRRSTAVTMAFAPTSRSAAHTARAHRHTPAAPDDRRRNKHPDRVVPVHPGDVGGQRRLADKYMVRLLPLYQDEQ